MNTIPTDKIHCKHFNTCDGCSILLHNIPKEWSSLLFWFEENKPSLRPHLISSDTQNWRHKAKLAVQSNETGIAIGLYRAGTHHVYDIDECPHHVRPINEAVSILRHAFYESGLTGCDVDKTSGDVNYIQLWYEASSRSVSATIVFTSKRVQLKKKKVLLRTMFDMARKGFWHSVWYNTQESKSNVIFSPEWERVRGKAYIETKYTKSHLFSHPALFSQAHVKGFNTLLKYVDTFIPKKCHICDLYGGVGTIGFFLLSKDRKVVTVEINPFARESFERTRAHLPPHIGKNIRQVIGDSKESIQSLKMDVVVVDPPRKGLGSECIELLSMKKAPTIIYVSCGAESLIHDMEKLQLNGYSIDSFRGFKLFPGTDHIECVAVLRYTN